MYLDFLMRESATRQISLYCAFDTIIHKLRQDVSDINCENFTNWQNYRNSVGNFLLSEKPFLSLCHFILKRAN